MIMVRTKIGHDFKRYTVLYLLGDNGGGAIIISELLLNNEKTGPLSSALMGLNLKVENKWRQKLFLFRGV
jgi:hypothetical protein